MINVVQSMEEMTRALLSCVCYISGPITGVEDYKENFARAERFLAGTGLKVINPAAAFPEGLPYEWYMERDMNLVDGSDALCFLPGYEKSNGATREAKRAQLSRKEYKAFTLEQFFFYRDFMGNDYLAGIIPGNDEETRVRAREEMQLAKDGIRMAGEMLAEWIETLQEKERAEE